MTQTPQYILFEQWANEIVGSSFGKLTVLRMSKETIDLSKQQRVIKCRARWDCKCDCGNMVVKRYFTLRDRPRSSCNRGDCNTRRLPAGGSAANSLLDSYKRAAKNRGYVFMLSESEFMEMTQKNCYYCDAAAIGNRRMVHHSKSEYRYNGIDRVDNNQGYILGNCVPSCSPCNQMKGTRSEDEFRRWAERVYDHQGLASHD